MSVSRFWLTALSLTGRGPTISVVGRRIWAGATIGSGALQAASAVTSKVPESERTAILAAFSAYVPHVPMCLPIVMFRL
ncbi:hypothetical protein D3C86_1903060 [compost metagenome]